MSDSATEFRDLREKTNRNRRQSLETGVQTIAIERAQLEMSLGNTGEAQKEFAVASRGADVIERFLHKAPAEIGITVSGLSAGGYNLRRRASIKST